LGHNTTYVQKLWNEMQQQDTLQQVEIPTLRE